MLCCWLCKTYMGMLRKSSARSYQYLKFISKSKRLKTITIRIENHNCFVLLLLTPPPIIGWLEVIFHAWRFSGFHFSLQYDLQSISLAVWLILSSAGRPLLFSPSMAHAVVVLSKPLRRSVCPEFAWLILYLWSSESFLFLPRLYGKLPRLLCVLSGSFWAASRNTAAKTLAVIFFP